ncbi:uncharacterized protein RHTO_06482 [Rhodotorula toruloides NP11]|uniref:Uncharacterized protein n=1 Tax=Rhodotorula toruloides (strain NP11) TaxID=1130832 RepID=M7X3W2_RHOT1|nr:uncharacterized protein RHTO_06482 [Rhodotorula toruloides NP11]EMS18339.1 hypothetical protein RHTO_06482 [Rhodotorula toruloides NP11]
MEPEAEALFSAIETAFGASSATETAGACEEERDSQKEREHRKISLPRRFRNVCMHTQIRQHRSAGSQVDWKVEPPSKSLSHG